MPSLGGVLSVLVLAYMLSSLSQVQETLLRKNMAFSRLAFVDVVASLVMTISAPYLAWRGWGIWALVAEQVSGLVARFLLTWGPFRQWRPSLGWDRAGRNWLWRYGKPVWVSANLGYLLDRFDDFWIGTALGNTALGYYSRSYEFAHYPRRVFANPLVSVFGPVFARLQDDRLQLSRTFYRSAHFILRTGFVIAGAFALVMPEFIHLVIGEKWLPMLWTFRLMLVYTALDPFLMLLGNLMLVVGRPESLQSSRLVQTAFFIPAVPLGAFLWGINGVALAADGMLLIGAWRLYRPVREVVDFSLWRLLVWPGIALVIAWTAGLLVEQLVIGGAWQVLLLKLGVFLLLFGGFLVGVERGDYFKGARLFRTALRRSRGQVS
jgi:PST family polysaccharide transporter